VGYVFQFEDALRYDAWLASGPGRTAVAVEKDLLQHLWAPGAPQTVLEVGCGTGLFLEWFEGGGHQVTGLDPSPYMLNLARGRVPPRVGLDRGYAEDLPYEDNAFDTVALITTLEFVNDPFHTIEEALRVARRHVLLGVLNQYSPATWQHCLKRLWKPSIYSHARFFSVFSLRNMITEALGGPVPLQWRTTTLSPFRPFPHVRLPERFRLLQRLPFGHFIAMRIDQCYPLRTVQQPIFHEMHSRVGQPHFRTLCRRDSKQEAPIDNRPPIPGQSLRNTDYRSKPKTPMHEAHPMAPIL
jgi:SAM-dependent methyltransferase